MGKELRASSTFAPPEIAKTLVTMSEEADLRFEARVTLQELMDTNLEELKRLSNEWVRDGLVGTSPTSPARRAESR